ncbi:hypothetical protein C8R44DRAFT_893264 [Mycena epipterygia]|nr:hypothetical protein C8R44DRAFT_893264 [Mycena epipterygia]
MSYSGYPTFNEETKSTDDRTLLAYKEELKREFTTLELFGFRFTISVIVPSIASVLFYSLPNGGPSAMVWGWATSSVFMFIAMAIAELGSSAPTSGMPFSKLLFINIDEEQAAYIIGPTNTLRQNIAMCWLVGYTNTITYISGVAGVGLSSAMEIMAAASISSDGSFIPTVHQTYDIYIAVLVTYGCISSCATRVLARFQHTFIALNVALVLAMVIRLPAAIPRELKNTAGYTFGNFKNLVDQSVAVFWFAADLNVISEEARNANMAVPWAIVYATGVGTSLGFRVQIALAFCMGTDTISILSSPIQ